MLRHFLVGLILRLGIALPLVIFAIVSFIRPLDMAAYYPLILINVVNEWVITFIGGVLAIALAAWIISKQKKFYSNLTFAVLLVLAVITNIQDIQFLLYVIPMACITLSLFIRDYPRVRVITSDKPL